MSSAPPPLPRLDRRASARWPLLFLLIPVIIGVALLYARFHLRREVQNRVNAVQRAKLPMSGAELNEWIGTIPEAENGALLLTEAFALIQRLPDQRSNVVTESDLFGTNIWTAEVQQIIREHLSLNAQPLEMIDRSLERERFRYPVDFSPGFATLLPHLRDAKLTARLLALRTAAAAQQHQTNLWPNHFLRQVKFAETLNSEFYAIGFLVRIACLKIAVNTLEQTLSHSAPGSLSVELRETLLAAARTNLLHPALIGERAMCRSAFTVSLGEMAMMSEDAEAPTDQTQRNFKRADGLMRLTGVMDRDENFYLRTMDQLIATALSPAPANLVFSDQVESAHEVAKRRFYIFSSMIIPALARLAERQAASQAYLHAAATATAVENFRGERGELPEQLEDLVPEFLMEIPTDPFDSKPIRYRRLNSGYCIYSIGADLHDDAGRPEPRRGIRGKTRHDLTFTVTR